jgi:phage tail-like protein
MRDMVYPHGSFRYKLEIDGLEAGGFSEVSGFDATVEVKEYREGDMPQTPSKVPGLKKYGNITLKQGLVDSTVLYDWIMKGVEGEVVRTTVTITLQDQTETDVASWQVINAWPTKYTAPSFNAGSSEVSIETLEIVHEGMTRVL